MTTTAKEQTTNLNSTQGQKEIELLMHFKYVLYVKRPYRCVHNVTQVFHRKCYEAFLNKLVSTSHIHYYKALYKKLVSICHIRYYEAFYKKLVSIRQIHYYKAFKKESS